MNSKRCAICRVLKQICDPNCIYKAHFPSNDTRFEDVHQIFGAKNVANILNNLGSEEQRKIAANSLCYAAEARRRDPVSGIHGMVQHYQSILNDVEQDIKFAENELKRNVGPDQVPKFVYIPIEDDFLTTSTSLNFFIEKIKRLTTVEKNQPMQLLKREDRKMGDGHSVNDASTSAGPSATLPKKHE
ncbi:PREDICTED: LOB domain-containing protein 32-like [Camelina sativa]|uniref:LOB domain-containing protein 32-like n=1 Tax=Camelina sativa TaxID=90675 RepID=A0ABM1QHL6_CAMSA|nr:PREDICTED: LOB domain-containing protein 32-like [Camelina sativa]